jgi:hypothetical protein
MGLPLFLLIGALSGVALGDPDFVEGDAFVDVSVPAVTELYGEVVVDPLSVDDVDGELFTISALFAEEDTPRAFESEVTIALTGALGDVSFELCPREATLIDERRRQSMHSLLSRMLRN